MRQSPWPVLLHNVVLSATVRMVYPAVDSFLRYIALCCCVTAATTVCPIWSPVRIAFEAGADDGIRIRARRSGTHRASERCSPSLHWVRALPGRRVQRRRQPAPQFGDDWRALVAANLAPHAGNVGAGRAECANLQPVVWPLVPRWMPAAADRVTCSDGNTGKRFVDADVSAGGSRAAARGPH